MKNPFVYGEPVSRENFADREEELERLKIEILSGQNVIIYSPRRFGKSSLAYNALLELEGKVIPIWIDCYGVLTKKELAEKIASQVLQHWRTKNLFESIRRIFKTVIPKIKIGEKIEVEFSIGEEERAFEEALKLPQRLAEHSEKRVAVVFDEFQEIAELGEHVLKKMRSEFQWHGDVTYIFIGSRRGMMEKIFHSAQSPFYNFGGHMVLKKIPKERFKEFLLSKFESTGVKTSPGLIERILDLTECHPYYTQKFCHELWYLGKLKGELTLEDVEETFERAIRESEASYIEIWESLPISQKKVLLAIARGEKDVYSADFLTKYELKTASQVQYSIKALRKKELIHRINGSYEISDPFLKHWLVWRFGRG